MTRESVVETPWSEPILFGEELEAPVFPTDRLPMWLGQFVRDQATASQVPEDLPGMIGLAALSAAVQGKINVLANHATWTEPVCLYAAVVMAPGERKSSVFSHMTRPLTQWELDVQELERPIVAASIQEHAELEQLVQSTQTQVNKANLELMKLRRGEMPAPDTLRAAEADLTMYRDAAIEAQIRLDAHVVRRPMRILYDDVTPEAAVTQLVEQRERIALMSPEGGIFDILGGRYSEKPALDIFLKGHSGDFVRVDRKSSVSATLHRPIVTLGLAIQPAVLSSIGKSRDMHGRGLLARFCYSLPNTMFGHREIQPAPVPDAVRAAYEANLRAIAQDAYAKESITTVCLDDEADGIFMGFQQALEGRLAPEEGDLDPIAEWASKLAGTVVRIAALLAAARCNGIPDEIQYDDMIGAIEFSDYLIAHAWKAYQAMGVIANVRVEQKIVRRITREGWTDFKTRDLQRALGAARMYSADELEELLEELVRRNYLRRVISSLKPLRTHWLVNPAVLEAVA
jgi:replicative DNA helicase